MLHLTLTGIIFCIFRITGILANINIFYEDISCPIVDTEYFTVPDVYVTDDNAIAVNFSIVKRLPDGIHGHFQLLGESMGDYTVPTGIEFNQELCEMLNEPIIFGPLLQVFGFAADNCPPDRGIYGCERYLVPTDNFPDDFQSNKYLATFEILSDDHVYVASHITVNVQN